MDSTMQAVLQFVEENDVKFIRLAFCDVMGTLKNIAIMPSELPRAFETGVSFDASSILGFAPVDKSDLFLFPDAATLSVLPWRPQTGRVVRFFCSVRTADGSPYGADGRHILRRTLRRLADAGYECRVGAECEFYLFERDAEGRPTKRPQDDGGYFDVAPLDRGENVRREICLTLEEMNIRPESSHHEQGPGQNEVDFKHAAPLTAADDVITFKNVVKTVAARNGLYGSFSPKPLADKPGSGMHVNISLARGGRNIFAPGPDGAYSPAMRSFIAGVLGVLAAGFVPPIFATGVDSYRLDRILGSLYLLYAVLALLNLIYWLGWFAQRRAASPLPEGVRCWQLCLCAGLLAWGLFATGAVLATPTLGACYSLVTGEAARYHTEMLARENALAEADSILEAQAAVQPLSAQPAIFPLDMLPYQSQTALPLSLIHI